MPFSDAGSGSRKPKNVPQDSTNQEATYLKYLTEKQRPVSVKLVDGEMVRGWVEYYDRNMIRVTREGQPNLFIFKSQIAYLVEEGS